MQAIGGIKATSVIHASVYPATIMGTRRYRPFYRVGGTPHAKCPMCILRKSIEELRARQTSRQSVQELTSVPRDPAHVRDDSLPTTDKLLAAISASKKGYK